jgi:hypothetical protein
MMRISMHRDHKIFIQAIKHKKKVFLTTTKDANGHTRTELCGPVFYVPASSQDGCAHYYFWDGGSGKRGNIFWVTPDQIISMEPTKEPFNPAGFIIVDSEHLLPEGSHPSGS